MDSRAWGPGAPAVLAVGAAGMLMAVGAALLVDDVPGRLLGGIAAAGLLIFAAGSWRARPRLAVAGPNLVYRGWFHTRTLRPADVESITIG